MKLNNKVIIVTGAAGGMGRAIVSQLLEQGAYWMRQELLKFLVKPLKNKGKLMVSLMH